MIKDRPKFHADNNVNNLTLCFTDNLERFMENPSE